MKADGQGPPASPGTVFTGQRRRANGPTLSHVSSVLTLPTDGHAVTYGPWTHACSARRHDGVSVTVSPESRRTATAKLSEYSSSDKGTEIDSRYWAAPDSAALPASALLDPSATNASRCPGRESQLRGDQTRVNARTADADEDRGLGAERSAYGPRPCRAISPGPSGQGRTVKSPSFFST